MEQSPRLSLSYVQPNQAQKHVTVNETFRRLDALTQMTVRSRMVSVQPVSPNDGDFYILPIATGDAWDLYDVGDLVGFQDGAWMRIIPVEGMRAWVADEDVFVIFDGTAWNALSGGGAESAARFGVNATADLVNRLSVKSDAILFNYDDVTPGSGDCRVNINKDASGDTASLLFQVGASGRAEFGLTSDDDFHVKVSADGSTWDDAMIIDKANANIGLGVAPSTKLHILGEAGTNPADGDIHLEKDGGFALVVLSEYSSASPSGSAFSIQRRARGTRSSPTAVLEDDWLGGFSFRGYADGGFQQRGLISGIVDGTVSGSSVPVALSFHTGVTGLNERMRISSDGGITIGSPTGASKGVGTINAEAVYDDNVLLSCYVFDQVLEGQIDIAKWDAKVPNRMRVAEHDLETELKPAQQVKRQHNPMRKFKARIGGEYDPLTLDGYARHWKEKRHLTAMPDEANFNPEQGLPAGAWVQRLIETAEIHAVLIETLNQKIKALEEASPGRSGIIRPV
ncbi:DUF2793 domain-containing protein [Hyphococcus lacteus]|uniref:DUF2793 domain-containing protein n=1 Tax=Hyphococcus lacteus TaxID=3143536 RepID=A0ABV3Z162_9PROT